jgi:hypothetical protein
VNGSRPMQILATVLSLAIFVAAGCSGGVSSRSAVAQPSSPLATSVPTGALLTTGSALPSGQQTAVAPAQAEATVRRIVPTGDLTVSGPTTAGQRTLYSVAGPGVQAMVDAMTGQLASVLFSDYMPITPAVTISATAAQADSLSFLSGAGLANDGLTPTVELVDHGDFKEYAVKWQLRVNGALVPEQRLASVNPQTGKVFSLVVVSVPYAAPPTPTISRQDAIAAANRLLGAPLTTVESSDLVVTFDGNGAQLLVWQIGVRIDGPTPSAAAMVQVDAMSGAATVIGRG